LTSRISSENSEPVNRYLCNGPKIAIGQDHIGLKERNTRLDYRDIRSVSIINARSHRAWLFYVVAGTAGLVVILLLLYLVIRGFINDPATSPGNSFYYRKHAISILFFFFIAGPVYLISRLRKYSRKQPMLIIRWEKHEYRIRVSELGVRAIDLKRFLEGKTTLLEYDIPPADRKMK